MVNFSLEAGTMPHTSATIEETRISDAIERVSTENERLIIVREGKGGAAIVPLDDLESLEELDEILDRADMPELEAARKEAQEKGTLPLSEFMARLGLSPVTRRPQEDE
jgi:prevent-host-death family protein